LIDTIGRIDVLDLGYVELVDSMGDEVRILEAARKSFDRDVRDMSSADEGLLLRLALQGHNVHRHCVMTFEVKAPLMVAREWWRYVVGSDHTIMGWNEVSRRYVKRTPDFYRDVDWMAGMAGTEESLTDAYHRYIDQGIALYEEALRMGAPAEKARLFLPAYGIYTRWYWTASLQSIAHFIRQRSDTAAQAEIREYAAAVRRIVEPQFPITLPVLVGGTL